MNLILVGFMGTGKTSAGRQVAARLGWQFVDTDVIIEARRGRTVAAIFAEEGEAAFRAAETEAVRAAAALREAVIATGGGVLNDSANLEALQASGVLVCLTALPEVILARVGAAPDRPLLAGAADPLAEIRRLLAARAAQYARADYQLDTSNLSIAEVVDQLCVVLPSLSPARLTRS